MDLGLVVKNEYDGIFPPDKTVRYVAFCEAYLVCFDAKQSAKIAGFTGGGATTTGPRLLEMESIQKYLQLKGRDKAREGLTAKYGAWSVEEFIECVKLMINMCFGHPTPLLTFDPDSRSLVPAEEDKTCRCPSCGGEVKYQAKMYKFDSNGAGKALELMGKNLQALTDKFVISSDVTPQMIEKVLKGVNYGN